MFAAPEAPFILAAALVVIASVAKGGKYPPHMMRAVLGTVVLAMFASATDGTKAAPVVRAIGLLFLLSAGMAAIVTIDKANSLRRGAKNVAATGKAPLKNGR